MFHTFKYFICKAVNLKTVCITLASYCDVLFVFKEYCCCSNSFCSLCYWHSNRLDKLNNICSIALSWKILVGKLNCQFEELWPIMLLVVLEQLLNVFCNIHIQKDVLSELWFIKYLLYNLNILVYWFRSMWASILRFVLIFTTLFELVLWCSDISNCWPTALFLLFNKFNINSINIII